MKISRALPILAALLAASAGLANECVDGVLPPTEGELAERGTFQFKFSYLDENAIDLKKILKEPPAATSKETRQELDEMLALQANRTDEDVERTKFEVRNSVRTFFGPPYGPLTAEEAAALEPLFVKVRNDVNYFSQAVKKVWKRDRPFITDPRIKPCVPLENTTSYPSGHAATSHLFALVLGELNPKRAKEIMASADRVGADRVLAGMHHPSDVEAGKEIADAVWKKLRTNSAFKKDLSEYKLP
ncbi:MAG: phosphatase PAP2 family protein [Bdellovibrionales bacterium]|nr:phosphatase PAP2 family protein [Bdellovibrionales bacterium]